LLIGAAIGLGLWVVLVGSGVAGLPSRPREAGGRGSAISPLFWCSSSRFWPWTPCWSADGRTQPPHRAEPAHPPAQRSGDRLCAQREWLISHRRRCAVQREIGHVNSRSSITQTRPVATD